MVTILLQKIIELLTGFFGDFIEWANTVGDKIASIKDNTDSLPDIKDNTDSIKNDTSSIKSLTQTNTTNTTLIHNKVNTIKDTTNVISNNVSSIATSSGTAAAFAEDIANNTLDMDSRLVTIGSDTTQIRADSGNLAADVAEIKDTLGLYLYNTIVTEDAEGDIASCDTDLKDYLTEAKVTIPADAGGITGINLTQCGANLFDEVMQLGVLDSNGNIQSSPANLVSTNMFKIVEGSSLYFSCVKKTSTTQRFGVSFYDKDGNYINNSSAVIQTNTFTAPINAYFMRFFVPLTWYISSTYENDISINYPSTNTDYNAYTAVTYPITFTSITDGAEIDLLSGIIKINTSPVTYDSITPIAIRTYKGVNNIYSDIGTTSVTYRETLKHYLKKQEA